MTLKNAGKHGTLLWLSIWWIGWSITGTGIASAQDDSLVSLQIWLRASDGSAVVGEPIILQRLPEEEDIPPALRQAQGLACRTDADGMCVWRVQQGLYQVLFDRPLDGVSALAVAEGGLSGLGITVSDVPIAYHFTFQSDGRVYFDASPEAAVPSPVITEPDELRGGMPAVVVPPFATDERINATPTSESIATPGGAEAASVNTAWLILFFVGLGLILGGVLHLLRSPLQFCLGKGSSGQVWRERRCLPHKTTRRETEDA